MTVCGKKLTSNPNHQISVSYEYKKQVHKQATSSHVAMSIAV